MSDQVHGFEVIEGRRVVLERELMWAAALGRDPARIEQLYRMLMSSANDSIVLRVTGADTGPPRAQATPAEV